MKIKNIFTLVAAVAVCALALATTAAVGDTNPSNGGVRDADASDVPASSGSLTPAPIQGVRTRLPAIAATQLEKVVPGAVPAESVAALEAAVGTLYLTPTADGACISFVRVGLGAGLTCAPDSPATTFEGCTGPLGEPPTCERALIYGRAPAGVDVVAVRSRDGSTLRSGDVTNGVYLFDVAVNGHPAAVEFQHAGEQVRQSVPSLGVAG